MIDLLIQILIFALVFGAIYYIITLLPIDPRFKQIVLIILGLIAVIWLIFLLLGVAGNAPRLDLRR
jgi:uncharacterized membrane protein